MSIIIRVYKRIKSRQKHSCSNLFSCCFGSQSFDLVNCIISYAPYPDDVNWSALFSY